MLKYYKLFVLLDKRNLKKTDLLTLADITSPTLAKLSKGAIISSETIDKICKGLNCQPGDIMEYIPNDSADTTSSADAEPEAQS